MLCVRRHWLIGLSLSALSLVGGCASEPSDAGGEDSDTATVSMPGFSFTPFTTTITVGGAVTFDFPNEEHNVIFVRKSGAPADIQPIKNAKVARTFPVAGTFPYDCTIHPGMSGEVVVR